MTSRTIIILIILAAILGIVFLVQQANRDDGSNNAVLSVSALNQTKNQDATAVTANPKDVVVYTLKAENPEDEVISGYVMEVNIADITEQATLIDAQGANYNSTNNTLSWSPLDIPENGSIEKQFTVRIKDELPASSDLVMTARFNNEVAVNISRTPVAVSPTPGTTPGYTAPPTGPSVWTVIYLAFAVTLGAFCYRYARSMGKI